MEAAARAETAESQRTQCTLTFVEKFHIASVGEKDTRAKFHRWLHQQWLALGLRSSSHVAGILAEDSENSRLALCLALRIPNEVKKPVSFQMPPLFAPLAEEVY